MFFLGNSESGRRDLREASRETRTGREAQEALGHAAHARTETVREATG